MSSPHSTGPGRHRGAGRKPTTLLATLWQRPTQLRSTLKGLGVAATALGVATAFSGPAESSDLRLATAVHHAPAEARAQAVSAPERVVSYGVIGFTAKAAPTPTPRTSVQKKAAVATVATAKRTPSRASRGANYSRSGLGALSGMSRNAVAVINEVHASFPALSNIGGFRAGDPGDHGSGHAVDIMCGTSDGNAVAAHLQGMAGTLGITYIIWQQRIWYPGRGWKAMADRGSATANHYDHVHVSVR
jgi:hypothetical protein